MTDGDSTDDTEITADLFEELDSPNDDTNTTNSSNNNSNNSSNNNSNNSSNNSNETGGEESNDSVIVDSAGSDATDNTGMWSDITERTDTEQPTQNTNETGHEDNGDRTEPNDTTNSTRSETRERSDDTTKDIEDSNDNTETNRDSEDHHEADEPNDEHNTNEQKITVAAESVGDSDPKSPPKTGNALRDYIYQYSWPGRRKFERNEDPIITTNPHVTSVLARYIISALFALSGVFLIMHYALGYTQNIINNAVFWMEITIPWWWVLICIGISIFGAAAFLYQYIRRMHTWYIITDQRTWVRKGVFSKTDEGDLNHQKLSNIEEENPFPLNLLNVGHIKLYTASTDEHELKIDYVKDPEKWKTIIRSETQKYLRDTRNTNEVTDE